MMCLPVEHWLAVSFALDAAPVHPTASIAISHEVPSSGVYGLFRVTERQGVLGGQGLVGLVRFCFRSQVRTHAGHETKLQLEAEYWH